MEVREEGEYVPITTLSPPEWLNSALRWAALNNPTSADHSLPPTKE